jgi:hypothetical protein
MLCDPGLPAFGYHVSLVGRNITVPQVCRVEAWRVITRMASLINVSVGNALGQRD